MGQNYDYYLFIFWGWGKAKRNEMEFKSSDIKAIKNNNKCCLDQKGVITSFCKTKSGKENPRDKNGTGLNCNINVERESRGKKYESRKVMFCYIAQLKVDLASFVRENAIFLFAEAKKFNFFSQHSF